MVSAAVCYEFGKPLVVEDVQIDPPQEDEVKVRISAAAVCHSDIHLLRGEALRNVIDFSPHQLERGKRNEPSDRSY